MIYNFFVDLGVFINMISIIQIQQKSDVLV